MNVIFKSVLMLIWLLILNGCAVGQKINYSNSELKLNASGNIMVAVASYDSRPYIKDREYVGTYVGTLRGGFGNPFNINTESGKPLANDMAAVICSSLKKKGFECTPVLVDPNELQVEITNKLKATNAKRLILLTINEWHSDTYVSTSLAYDIGLSVIDEQGISLAEKKLKGEDDLGKSGFTGSGSAKELVPVAYKNKLELLLNDVAVINALK